MFIAALFVIDQTGNNLMSIKKRMAKLYFPTRTMKVN